jgi:hypothetical protein
LWQDKNVGEFASLFCRVTRAGVKADSLETLYPFLRIDKNLLIGQVEVRSKERKGSLGFSLSSLEGAAAWEA